MDSNTHNDNTHNDNSTQRGRVLKLDTRENANKKVIGMVNQKIMRIARKKKN